MKKNTKAQMFALYLVVLTLLMCLTIILLYMKQSSNVAASLVSPVTVLQAKDSQEQFEQQEQELITLSAQNVLEQDNKLKKDLEQKNAFDSTTRTTLEEQFKREFRKKFFDSITQEPTIKNYLQEHLTLNGKEVTLTEEEYQLFIQNYLYPEQKMFFKEKNFIITREPITKYQLLTNGNLNTIRFPVGLQYTFNKTYTLNENMEVL